MPGIAFGLKYGEQLMGDVLVSARLGLYERSKITEQGAILDPNTPEAERFLVNHFETCSLPWRKTISKNLHPKVHSGLLLTGEKLVNSKTYVEQLIVSFPKAIGGEMEGRAVYKACAATKTPWILAKSICDWGFGKNDDFQIQAARNSLSFVFHALESTAFKDKINKHNNSQIGSDHQTSNKANSADAKSRAAD
jgi:nucleoside phosphorylase